MELISTGLVTDDVAREKERRLRDALRSESEFQVKEGTSVEVAQVSGDRYLLPRSHIKRSL